MDSRIFIALALFAVASAIEELAIEIEETGEKFKEIVDFDFKNGIEVVKTPAHGQQLEAVEVFKDLRRGFKAVKMPKLKHCYVMKLEAVDQNMYGFERGLKLARGHLPKNHITKHRENVVVIGDVPAAWNSKKLEEFCRDNKIVLAKAFESTEDIEKIAVKMAVDARKNMRKRKLITEFVACDTRSTLTIGTCTTDNLKAHCRVREKSCTYVVTCPYQSSGGGPGEYDCGAEHRFDSVICCNYVCNT